MTEDQMFVIAEMLWDECWLLLISAEVDGDVTHVKVVDPPDAPDARPKTRVLTVEGTSLEEVLAALRELV
jgi:hypothetical protein